MYYLFPFHLVEKGSDIVLYGAGIAGQNFAKQIELTGHCNIVGVCDRDYEKKHVRNIETWPISRLKDATFDYIVITQVKEEIQNSVKRDLLAIGIEEEKIISFVSPVMDWDNPNRGYFSQHEEYELNKNLGEYIEEIDPTSLIASNRIDVMVRVLFFRDLMLEIENKEHLSLFTRFTMARTGGHEMPSYFSGKGKSSVEEFIERGRELVNEIKQNGFEPERYIPLGNGRKPYDGLHRLAATIVAGEKIFVKEYADRDALDCNMEWFRKEGFTFEDRLRIVRCFSDTYPGDMGIFVLYAPLSNLWEYMQGRIAAHFKVIDVIDFDYSDNYIAFENVLRQIYWDQNHYSEWLTRKLDMLSLAELKYRIIVVSDENGHEDFFGEIRKFKLSIREGLQMDVDGRVPIQIHSSDNSDEFRHLSKIFLSVNQYKWDNRKLNTYYRGWFLGAIDKLKGWCAERNINIDDICVVGSAVMELFGLRQANNLNFVVKSNIKEHLEMFQNGGNDEDIEIKDSYAMDENGNMISDDILITDPEYHIVFNDIKFCNPEFVYRRKKCLNREKDKWDVKRLEDFKQMVIGMEDRRYLNMQVEKELYKRGLRI